MSLSDRTDWNGNAPERMPRERLSRAELAERRARIERFAEIMDRQFRLPVLGWRVGLDGLIGLVPGIGDTVSTGISGWLMAEGWRLGARKRTLGRMGLNLGIDWVIGLVPLVGDLLDIAHKANAKNARLLLDDIGEDATLRRA
ncbi:MAG: DUF4112 domain-containing protein [Pseudomonadota bacterium]